MAVEKQTRLSFVPLLASLMALGGLFWQAQAIIENEPIFTRVLADTLTPPAHSGQTAISQNYESLESEQCQEDSQLSRPSVERHSNSSSEPQEAPSSGAANGLPEGSSNKYQYPAPADVSQSSSPSYDSAADTIDQPGINSSPSVNAPVSSQSSGDSVL